MFLDAKKKLHRPAARLNDIHGVSLEQKILEFHGKTPLGHIEKLRVKNVTKYPHFQPPCIKISRNSQAKTINIISGHPFDRLFPFLLEDELLAKKALKNNLLCK